MSTTLVFAGGPPGAPVPSPAAVRAVAEELLGSPTGLRVVAADSGLHLAEALGVVPDVVVGDMDSVTGGALERVAAAGARIERHPEDKDRTDLELALAVAAAEAPERIVVIASADGRLDHLLGVVAAVTTPALAPVEVTAWVGPHRVLPVHSRRTVSGVPGALVSLLAVGGPARGVSTTGLHWPLEREDLDPFAGRSLSNRFAGAAATVEVAAGALVVIIPEEEEEPS
ncbi:MAG: thiamine diphosphokinase [Microthrixaceae bacterium]